MKRKKKAVKRRESRPKKNNPTQICNKELKKKTLSGKGPFADRGKERGWEDGKKRGTKKLGTVGGGFPMHSRVPTALKEKNGEVRMAGSFKNRMGKKSRWGLKVAKKNKPPIGGG